MKIKFNKIAAAVFSLLLLIILAGVYHLAIKRDWPEVPLFKGKGPGSVQTKYGIIENNDMLDGKIEDNISAVLSFADYAAGHNKQLYFALLPTAAGIYYPDSPEISDSGAQRRNIEYIYNKAAGKLTYLDVYSTLSSKKNSYIYMRTENMLTSTGGYYVYTLLAKRMLKLDNPSLSDFDIEYYKTPYYGSLYKEGVTDGVNPDTLMLYRYKRHNRIYDITVSCEDDTVKNYSTLYPAVKQGENPFNIFIGGPAPVCDISINSPYYRRLLVISDESAVSFTPFIANHYEHVTVANLKYASSFFKNIDIDDYDQILIIFNIENFSAPNNIGENLSSLIK